MKAGQDSFGTISSAFAFAARTDWETAPSPRDAALAAARAAGRPLWDLTETNPTRCGFAYLESGLETALASPAARRYVPDPFGMREARMGIAADYARQGLAVDPARIMLTAGTSEAYGHLFRLLANPGDTVLVPSPSYPLLDLLARLHDVRVRAYPLHHDNGRWWLDLEALAAAIDSTCRAIVVITPNNPTGSYLSGRERAALEALAAARGLALVADEVFADFDLDGNPERAGSFASGGPALTFTLNGLSKMLGLPQMKLAWTVVSGPAALAADAVRRLETIADTYLSVGTPVQAALAAWWPRREAIQAEIRARLMANRRAIPTGRHFNALPVEGGWQVVLRVPATADDVALAEDLVTRADVVLDPGRWYGLPPAGYLVASLLTPEPTFAEGLRRLNGLW